jgi:hypothetical protein
MPTRKQRRRRQKELRHEYEYVYVDEEGHEVDVDRDEVDDSGSRRDDRGSRRNGKRDPKRPAQKGRQERPIRPVAPPSWRKVAKRALLFGPLIFLAFSAINSGQPIASRLAVSAIYTAFFVPLMYLMDRAMYRSYLRRTGQDMPRRPTARKR